jgi:hypothetical protein
VVTCDEAKEVWDAGFEYRGNRTGRTAEWLAIGRTATGRLVTISVIWDDDFSIWVAYNAWDTKTSDW